MSKIALFAEFEAKPEHRDAFQSLMREHAKAALDRESGCLQFDVTIGRENPNQVVLYEVYEDQKALEEHMASPGLAETRQAYAHMIATKRVLTCRIV